MITSWVQGIISYHSNLLEWCIYFWTFLNTIKLFSSVKLSLLVVFVMLRNLTGGTVGFKFYLIQYLRCSEEIKWGTYCIIVISVDVMSHIYFGIVVVVLVWWLDLELHMPSVPITTKIVSSNPVRDEV